MSDHDAKIKEAKQELDAAQRKYNRLSFMAELEEISTAKPLRVNINPYRVLLELHGRQYTVQQKELVHEILSKILEYLHEEP